MLEPSKDNCFNNRLSFVVLKVDEGGCSACAAYIIKFGTLANNQPLRISIMSVEHKQSTMAMEADCTCCVLRGIVPNLQRARCPEGGTNDLDTDHCH